MAHEQRVLVVSTKIKYVQQFAKM